mmetsp:Transcript_12446/g.20234  ORF Transcript_12446/g.20234 Transcript_12446/m.20234 type:complete len:429 (-) Transcript_12446:23-1309(-)
MGASLGSGFSAAVKGGVGEGAAGVGLGSTGAGSVEGGLGSLGVDEVCTVEVLVRALRPWPKDKRPRLEGGWSDDRGDTWAVEEEEGGSPPTEGMSDTGRGDIDGPGKGRAEASSAGGSAASSAGGSAGGGRAVCCGGDTGGRGCEADTRREESGVSGRALFFSAKDRINSLMSRGPFRSLRQSHIRHLWQIAYSSSNTEELVDDAAEDERGELIREALSWMISPPLPLLRTRLSSAVARSSSPVSGRIADNLLTASEASREGGPRLSDEMRRSEGTVDEESDEERRTDIVRRSGTVAEMVRLTPLSESLAGAMVAEEGSFLGGAAGEISSATLLAVVEEDFVSVEEETCRSTWTDGMPAGLLLLIASTVAFAAASESCSFAILLCLSPDASFITALLACRLACLEPSPPCGAPLLCTSSLSLSIPPFL